MNVTGGVDPYDSFCNQFKNESKIMYLCDRKTYYGTNHSLAIYHQWEYLSGSRTDSFACEKEPRCENRDGGPISFPSR